MKTQAIFNDQGYQIHWSDALEYMKKVRDDEFECVLTSPPTEVELDENYRSRDWKFDQRWLTEARRISSGPVIFTLHPVFLEQLNEKPDHIGVWCIPAKPGRSLRWPNQAWNAVVMYDLLPIGYESNDWWICSPPQSQDHPAPSPLELFRELLKMTRGKTVLDPFCGIGTTLHAAASLEFERAVGVDHNEAYCYMASARLESALARKE